MTDKELHRLSRRELLEMLIEQGRELEQVRQELDEAREKLNQREIALADCGSIAEASLKLSGVFEAAQAAADQYLESLKVANPDQGLAKAAAEEIPGDTEQDRELQEDQQELDETTEKLNEREIASEDHDSIAEASLKLSGVFEAAQAAADQYLESLKVADPDQGQPKAAAEQILYSAEQEYQALLERTRQECAAMIAKVKEEL